MNDRFLEQKNAIVTGGSRGIGFAIAKALAGAGAAVAICGRSQNTLDLAVSQLTKGGPSKVIGKVADVSNSTEVVALFEFVDKELGGPDILVNNAGIGVFKPYSRPNAGRLEKDHRDQPFGGVLLLPGSPSPAEESEEWIHHQYE
jgi:NAD(P)-dependent dehydrogenase (short-subunit alcohol dehydrogenase family)